MLHLGSNHRHLSNIDCLTVCTPALFASLVLLMAAAEKNRSLLRLAQVEGT